MHPSKSQSRILILSLRNTNNYAFNSSLYEFEDIIAEIDNVDIVTFPKIDFKNRLRKKILQSATEYLSPQFANLSPTWHPKIFLDKKYEVIFFIIDFPCNVVWLDLIEEWRSQGKICIAYLAELWHNEFELVKNHLQFFNKFDLVFLGHIQVVERVDKFLVPPCKYLLPGIDAISFVPKSLNTKRAIDLCSIGRRSPVTHNALLKLSAEEDFFYHYDPPRASVTLTDNYRFHRIFNAHILKNSRYFITNYAKFDEENLISDQVEIGSRFFEGAAAGTVMLGATLKGGIFEQYFDWEDAVIPLKYDESNIREAIAELDRQPERLAKIRRNNTVNTLLRHDWSYRWAEILQQIDLLPQAELYHRHDRLKELAESLYKSP